MSSRRLLVSVLLAVMAIPAVTQNQRGVKPEVIMVNGKHAAMTLTIDSRRSLTPTNLADSGLVTIFNSLTAGYPKGYYWCCEGYNVMGPSSGVGEQWMGAAFTPSANHTVTTVAVAVGYSQQGANGVVISLNEDSNGVPGQALKAWTVTGLPRFGSCCTLVVRSEQAGIPVTGGKQYWVVASTASNQSDTVDGWNVADADQVDAATVASFTGTQWTVFQATPGLAFAVLGSN